MMLVLLPQWAAAQVMYRWTDDTGKVWVTDRVPPGHTKYDREVVNAQGIVIRREKGETTPEQAEAQKRQEAIETAERLAREERARQDRILLDNYLTEAAIVRNRDRRLVEADAKIANLEQRLEERRDHLTERMGVAQNFKPYSKEENARPLPPAVVNDIAQTEREIASFEAALQREHDDRETLRQNFERDILRFRELKQLEGPGGPVR